MKTIRVIVEKWMAVHRKKFVDIVIAGRVFGGRFGESPQRPRSVECTASVATIYFQPTERLVIANPNTAEIGSSGELIIPQAAQAIFGWHYYGRPRTHENWCEEIYTDCRSNILFTRIGPSAPTHEKWGRCKKPFVVLY